MQLVQQQQAWCGDCLFADCSSALRGYALHRCYMLAVMHDQLVNLGKSQPLSPSMYSQASHLHGVESESGGLHKQADACADVQRAAGRGKGGGGTVKGSSPTGAAPHTPASVPSQVSMLRHKRAFLCAMLQFHKCRQGSR